MGQSAARSKDMRVLHHARITGLHLPERRLGRPGDAIPPGTATARSSPAGRQTLAGYNPERLTAMWQEASKGGGDYREKLKRMRRDNPMAFTDGVYPTRPCRGSSPSDSCQ